MYFYTSKFDYNMKEKTFPKGSANEFYYKEYGIDLTEYDRNKASIIGSSFLEDLIYPKDELLEFLGEPIKKEKEEPK